LVQNGNRGFGNQAVAAVMRLVLEIVFLKLPENLVRCFPRDFDD